MIETAIHRCVCLKICWPSSDCQTDFKRLGFVLFHFSAVVSDHDASDLHIAEQHCKFKPKVVFSFCREMLNILPSSLKEC